MIMIKSHFLKLQSWPAAEPSMANVQSMTAAAPFDLLNIKIHPYSRTQVTIGISHPNIHISMKDIPLFGGASTEI